MKKLKLVALVAGLSATGLISVAQAGQIQASATAYAREAIRTDAQTVAMPVLGYKLNGSVDARTQVQQFSIKVTMQAGAFAVAPTVGEVYLRDQGLSSPLVTPQSTSLNAGGTVLTINFNMPVNNLAGPGGPAFYPNPIIVINEKSAAVPLAASTYGDATLSGGVGSATVKNLFTGLADFGAEVCPDEQKFVKAVVQHFDSAGQEDDSLRSGNQNTANVLALNVTHYIDVQANTKAGTTTAVSGNQLFAAGNGGGGTAAGAIAVGGGTGALTTTTVMLGRFDLTGAGGGAVTRDVPASKVKILSGFDRDGNNFYTAKQGAAPAVLPNPDNGGYVVGGGALQNGAYQADKVNVTVTALGGFAVGSDVFLSATENCAGALGTVTTTAGQTSAAISIAAPAAPWQNAGFVGTSTDGIKYSGVAAGPRLYICYKVPGNVQVPATSFSATVAVTKVGTEEQTNSCKGDLYSLGGALKIDVRNYMPVAVTQQSGWLSVLRLINTSDSFDAVKVYGQTIHADGKLGNSALLATLKARQAMYMTNSEIETKLLAGSAPAATLAANNGAAVSNGLGVGALPDNARIRITAEGGNTLRVQNYLFNKSTEQLVEASGSQGVDFAVSGERAPAGEGQYQDQDAQSGINLK